MHKILWRVLSGEQGAVISMKHAEYLAFRGMTLCKDVLLHKRLFFVMLACVNICRVHSPRDVQNPMKSGSCIHTIALHVKRWAKLFNNIGLLSVSAKGAASAAWCSSRDLSPFTGALIPLKHTFTIQHKKTQKPMIPICPGISD